MQCTGCLALLALLRGESPASDAARQRMEDGEVVRTVAEGGCSVWAPAGSEGTGALQYQLQGRNRDVPSFIGSGRLGFKVKTW